MGGLPNITLLNRFAGLFRPFERLFRLYVRSSLALEDSILVVFNSGIYNVDLNNQTITKEHVFNCGMRHPLAFTKVRGINNFEDCVLYGEYTNNPLRKSVSIYKRDGCAKWEIIYTFPPNTIKHVHALIPDPYRQCVLILTGDNSSESGIWIAKNNFHDVKPLFIGRQEYRSCVAWPEHDGILYASDTPFMQNALYFIRNEKDGELHRPQKIFDMPGPCIYSCKYKGKYYFSTSVEPDPNNTGLKRYVSTKPSVGCLNNKSHIITGNLNGGFKIIKSFEKDNFPPTLFEFGNIRFVTSKNHLYFYPAAMKFCDGILMEMEE